MVALAIAASAFLHDSALSGIVALGGVCLVIYAFLAPRLISFGPTGIVLEKFANDVLLRVARAKPITARGTGEAHDATIRTSHEPEPIENTGSYEALVSAFAERLQRLERPETRFERNERVGRDDAVRRRNASYRTGGSGQS